MRCSVWSSLAISVCSALVLAGAARAHVTAEPAFLPSGGSRSIAFVGPNERAAPMDGFSLTVPPGLVIERAHDANGWRASLEGRTARWTGGSLAPGDEIAFSARIAATGEPGAVRVLARQRFADGGEVGWPVLVTVTPKPDSPSRNFTLAGGIALAGAVLVIALTLLTWRRRGTA